jgi:hypothetical protein
VSVDLSRDEGISTNAREMFTALRPARCEVVEHGRRCGDTPRRNCARCHLWLCDRHTDRRDCESRDGLIAGVRHTS